MATINPNDLSPTGRAALEYVEQGLAVVPITVGEKKPSISKWTSQYFTTPEQVAGWWGKNPNQGVGIVTGAASSGVFVLDLDRHKEDADGAELAKKWQDEHGAFPETWTVITGSGGTHLYFRGDVSLANSANEFLGVDVRATGGFAVAPPTTHPATGAAYEWSISPDDMEVAEANDSVLAFIEFVREDKERRKTEKKAKKGAGEGTGYKLPGVIEKGGRNDELFRYLCSRRGKGLGDAEISALAAEANRTRCKPALDQRELDAIIKSVCSYEAGGDREGTEVPGVATIARNVKIRGSRGGIQTNVLAREIIDRYRARIIDGAPAVWTGQRWEFGKRAINRCALRIADDAKKRDRDEVVSYIQDMAPHVSASVEFDGGWYVQFENCTIDVMTMQVVEPAPEMQIYATVPAVLDMERAKVPNYADEFLRSVSAGDPDVIRALCEVIGSCMTSRIAVPQAAFLVGRAGNTGRGRASNGKSTFSDWIRCIAGSRNVSALELKDFGERFAAGGILGKTANIGDDISSSFLRQDALSLFKKLATGEVIHADVKNMSPIEFRPVAQHVYSMNEVPDFEKVTEGELRRLAFIPFRARFCEEAGNLDLKVAEKLAAEEVRVRGAYSGLVALRGAIERTRFTEIPDMAGELDAVRMASDSVLRWLEDERIEAGELVEKKFADAYKRYELWAECSGERHPVKKAKFMERLNLCGWFGEQSFKTVATRVDGKGAKVIRLDA